MVETRPHPLFLMAEKLSRQTGHCRAGDGGFPAIVAWQLEHILEEMVVEVMEAAGTLLVVVVVGESVRSMVRLAWDSGASGELIAGVNSSYCSTGAGICL